ncbi:hypothetical protein D3C72_1988720 [compost metagenome]
MLAGLGITLYYMVTNTSPARAAGWQSAPPSHLWWGIQPTLAAVFGVPVGVLVIWVVSCLTRRTTGSAVTSTERQP